MSQPYRLDSPRVQEMQQLFLQNRQFAHRGNSCRITFEALYSSMLNGATTLAEVADRAGITESSVRSLYDRYLMPLLDNQTPKERRLAYIRRLRDERQRLLATLPDRPWVAPIVAQATAAGLTVAPCVHLHARGRMKVITTRIKIGGIECAIHPITKAKAVQGERSVRYRPLVLGPELERAAFHICPVLLPNWRRNSTLIFPREFLRNHVDASGRVRVGIPFYVRKPYREKHQRFDPWEFENKWELILKTSASPIG